MNLNFFFSVPFPVFSPLLVYVCFSLLEGFPPYQRGIYFLNLPNTLLARTILFLLPSPNGRQLL